MSEAPARPVPASTSTFASNRERLEGTYSALRREVHSLITEMWWYLPRTSRDRVLAVPLMFLPRTKLDPSLLVLLISARNPREVSTRHLLDVAVLHHTAAG